MSYILQCKVRFTIFNLYLSAAAPHIKQCSQNGRVLHSQTNVNNCLKGCSSITLSVPDKFFFFLLQKEWITEHAGGSLGAGAEAVRGGGGPAKPRQCPVPGTGLAAQREAAGGPGPASLPRKAGPSSGAHRRCRLALSGPRQRRGEGSDRNRRPTSGKRRVEGGAAAAPRPASRSAALARLLSLRTASSRAARKSPPRPHRPAACRTRAARPLTAGLGRAGPGPALGPTPSPARSGRQQSQATAAPAPRPALTRWLLVLAMGPARPAGAVRAPVAL